MRIATFVITILILSVFMGCKKVQPVPDDYLFLVGDYEWSYSTTGDIQNADNSTSSYGIRIDKRGYLYTYKDGKKQHKYKIAYYQNNNTFATYNEKEISITGRVEKFEGGQKEVVISYFPNATMDVSNHFLDYE